MSWLFPERCGLCRQKVPKGMEHVRRIKVPGYGCETKRVFCGEEHAEGYEALIRQLAGRKACCCDTIQPRRSES